MSDVTLAVIFDLDNTLSDCSDRMHFINRPTGEKDWDGFHAGCAADPPYEHVLAYAHKCAALGLRIIIMTGRPERYREMTTEWLTRHSLHPTALYMRPEIGRTAPSDAAMKRRWAKMYNPSEVLMVLDDRASVVEMFRGLGFTTCYPPTSRLATWPERKDSAR